MLFKVIRLANLPTFQRPTTPLIQACENEIHLKMASTENPSRSKISRSLRRASI